MREQRKGGESLNLFTERFDEEALLRPIGDWDQDLSREIRDEVLGLLAVGVRDFRVSLSRVGHIHYQTLSELKQLYGRVAALGGRLALYAPSPYLLEILAAGDIPRTIPVFPSEASAAMGFLRSSAAELLSLHEGEREGEGLAV